MCPGLAKLLKTESRQISAKRLLRKIALESLQSWYDRVIEMFSRDLYSLRSLIGAGVFERSSRRKLYGIPQRFHGEHSDCCVAELRLSLSFYRFPLTPLLVSFSVSVLP